MTDIVSKSKRSQMMSGIKGRNTKPEVVLRKKLYAEGYRYRLHQKIEGTRPDLVLRKFNSVIFVHGCFWHRHINCSLASTPKSRTEFWESKFASNVERDLRQKKLLLEAGWRVATVWECNLRSTDKVVIAVSRLNAWLVSQGAAIEI